MFTQSATYKESWRVFSNSWKLVLLILAVTFAFGIFGYLLNSVGAAGHKLPADVGISNNPHLFLSFSSKWIRFFLFAFLAFAVVQHQFRLRGLDKPKLRSRFLNFLAGAIVLYVAIDGLAEVLLSPLLTFVTSNRYPITLSVAGLAFAEGLVQVLVISFVGTWLIASIVGKDLSVQETLGRGRRQFLWTLKRFLLGPVPFALVGLVLYGLVSAIFANAFENYRSQPEIYVYPYLSAALIVAFATAYFIVYVFCVVMGAVILGKALLRDERLTPHFRNDHTSPV